MKWMLITLIPLIGVVFGCNSMDATRQTATAPEVAEPAREMTKKAEDTKGHADAIGSTLPHLTWRPGAPEVKATPPDADPQPPKVQLKPHVDKIKANSNNIIAEAQSLADIQPQLNDDYKELRQARVENRQRADWWWNMLKIAGVVTGSVVAFAIGYLGGIQAGLFVGIGGWTLAGAAQFWQSYSWIPTLIIGAGVVLGLCYGCYRVWLYHDTMTKERAGLKPGKQGKKLQAEVQDKAEKKKRKLQKKHEKAAP